MWHAENKNATSSSRASGAASGQAGGLTPEQVEKVGHTFTYKSAQSAAHNDEGKGVGMIEKATDFQAVPGFEHGRRSHESPAARGPTRTPIEEGLSMELVKVRWKGEPLMLCIFVACILHHPSIAAWRHSRVEPLECSPEHSRSIQGLSHIC